jgi:hypothetical protein
MNTCKSCLLTLAAAFAFTSAHAQDQGVGMRSLSHSDTPTSHSNSATSSTGTIMKKNLRWNSKIPLDKTYGELTPEQKDELHKMYEALPAGDEPPFPAEGIKPIFNAIKKAQRVLQARGELNLRVTVGPDGKATAVENVGTVRNVKMNEVAQEVLLLTTYKPAVCSGQPCTMQYRFTQDLAGG